MNAQPQDVELYIEAFEKVRAAGPVNDLLAFAPPADHPSHMAVLQELVRIDLEIGWEQGKPTSLMEYQRRFGQLFNQNGKSEIAYEEYRLRHLAGENPSRAEYRERGFDVTDWPSRFFQEGSSPASPTLQMSHSSDADLSESRPQISVVRPGSDSPTAELSARLQRRLRFVALGCTALPGYFSLLVWLNPTSKVAFSLEDWRLVATTWFAFFACAAIATALWTQLSWSLPTLRRMEVVLFGLTLAQMSLGFFCDVFVARELRDPFTQGEHYLFHYGSSWSLPFVILIVSYGTLVPSSWRRCTRIVAVMSIVPLAIALTGGIWEGVLNRTYIQSFILQMALWLTAASGIAIYGTRRIEILQQQVLEARRLGQYRLKERLGVGGMGEVYLAEHVLLRRPCAVKLIRAKFAGDSRARRRFENEVRTTAALTHPNTIQIFDYGNTRDGMFYYVMEYLPGLNLEQVVAQQGRLSPLRAVRIMQQVCGSLREAHAAGLIHRDLKPGNVIICERGGIADTAKLLDFGLVTDQKTANDQKIVSDHIVGSPLFMSPEQAAGRTDVDARADIYGLGALLYFLVTGQPPFVRATAKEALAAHLHEPITRPTQIRPDLTQELEAVITRCLEKNPAGRYQNVDEFQVALDSCQNL